MAGHQTSHQPPSVRYLTLGESTGHKPARSRKVARVRGKSD
jgi:hypothetical protein